MEWKEEPRAVNLKLQIGKSGLIIRAVAVSTVDVSLLLEAAWIIFGEGSHDLHSFVEFSYVCFIG